MTKQCLLCRVVSDSNILMANTSTHKCDFSGWTCGVYSNTNRTKTFTWPKRQLNTKIQCADIIWLLTFPCIGGRPKILVGCSNWYRQLALVDMDKPLSLWKKYLDFFTAVCWACHAGVFSGKVAAVQVIYSWLDSGKILTLLDALLSASSVTRRLSCFNGWSVNKGLPRWKYKILSKRVYWAFCGPKNYLEVLDYVQTTPFTNLSGIWGDEFV